jgi:hypothetical protein
MDALSTAEISAHGLQPRRMGLLFNATEEQSSRSEEFSQG